MKKNTHLRRTPPSRPGAQPRRVHALLVCSLLSIGGPATAHLPDPAVLLSAYLRFSLAEEVQRHAEHLQQGMPPSIAQQIEGAASRWFQFEITELRSDLDRHFGTAAREQFEQFVAEYTAAEEQQDAAYLQRLTRAAGLETIPHDYATLRRLILENWLTVPFTEATQFLSDVQTWADCAGREPSTPPLTVWLTRDSSRAVTPTPPAAARPAPATPPPPRRPVNPLMAAEAPAPAWDENAMSGGSALDDFAQRRQDRRATAMQQAQAGMQQMAMERQSAEQEYAARQMAAAQADAEAMRAQAQQLASAEAEAMKQRENSWGNRIKRIVGGTVSAGVGAFTGGVGAEAGRRAADELFR